MEGAMTHSHLFLIQMAVTGFIAIVAYLLKRSIGQIDDRLSNGDDKFRKIYSDSSEMRETRGLDREYFSKEYVSKDDFIRELRALEFKVDGIATDVKKLLTWSGRRDNHDV